MQRADDLAHDLLGALLGETVVTTGATPIESGQLADLLDDLKELPSGHQTGQPTAVRSALSMEWVSVVVLESQTAPPKVSLWG